MTMNMNARPAPCREIEMEIPRVDGTQLMQENY